MRLQSIKLAGFKSFVDVTKVDFPSKIAAIVGPNGCGKSNIIDAVRWVMGEGSAKALRGESMADVIFNGSTKRAPVEQASIELHFDNSDGSMGGEYSNYSEIVIRRQVTRDGQSNYYLNGARCRRKDIHDLFLGTGLGPRSYSIIEQGMISRMIEAKPDELRVMLEEAAGISKYKERRKETHQRMEHTRDNLLRLNDIREELQKQLGHLERQAKSAEKYKEYKAEERLVKAQLIVFRHHLLQEQLQRLKSEHEVLLAQLENHQLQQEQLEQDWQEHLSRQESTQEELERYQNNYFELNNQIVTLKNNVENAKLQHQQLENALADVTNQKEQLARTQTLDEERLAVLLQDQEANQAAMQQAEAELQQLQAISREQDERLYAWQSQWEVVSTTTAEASKTAQVEQMRIQHIEQRIAHLEQLLTRHQQELAELEQQEAQDQLDQKAALMNEAKEKREQKQYELTAHKEAIEQASAERQMAATQMEEARGVYQNLQAQWTALQTLQQEALGKKQSDLKPWLEKNQLENRERLAQVLQVQPGYEIFVEHYLGDLLQAICVDDFESYLASLHEIEQGQLSLVKKAVTASSVSSHHAQSLSAVVTGPQALENLMLHVYVAEDYQAALSLLATLPANAKVITRDGLVLSHDCLQVKRGKDEQSGVLSRQREIQALEIELQNQEQQVSMLEMQLEAAKQKLQTAQQIYDEAQHDLRALEQEYHQHHAAWQINQAKKQQRSDRMQKLMQESQDYQAQQATLSEEHSAARQVWQEALAKFNELQSQRDSLSHEQQIVQQAVQEARSRVNACYESLQQLRIKAQSIQTEQQSLMQQQTRLTDQQTQLVVRTNELQQRLTEVLEPVDAWQESIETLLMSQQEVSARIDELKAAAQELAAKLKQVEEDRKGLQSTLNELQQKQTQQQVQLEHLQTKDQGLLEQVAEEDINIEEVTANLPETMNENEWQENLTTVAKRIERLGAINLAAVEEYQQQSERKEYLDKQYQDLVEALTALEEAIRTIDEETKVKFQETFNQINHNFQTLFPRVFGGGRAYLELTSDDLLTAGAAVFAQPPGKKNSSIHLLSGGEKALTAVSLVFAIFEINPAPFCMLDEVDAPLDDANVNRFCNLVKHMSNKTQFIMVTHNKVAMEMADHLMGVTMHEPGVSRIVAVDVDNAVTMSGIKPKSSDKSAAANNADVLERAE